MEQWWSDPHRFDPDRFARNEHKQHNFQWAPFGGGAHKCIGLHFADMLFKTTLARLLLSYRLRFAREDQYPSRMQHFPFAKPFDNLPLVLEPRADALRAQNRDAVRLPLREEGSSGQGFQAPFDTPHRGEGAQHVDGDGQQPVLPGRQGPPQEMPDREHHQDEGDLPDFDPTLKNSSASGRLSWGRPVSASAPANPMPCSSPNRPPATRGCATGCRAC